MSVVKERGLTERGPLTERGQLLTERGQLATERGSILKTKTKDRAVTDIREDYKKVGAPLPTIEFLQELQKRTKAIRVLQLDYESSSDEEEGDEENENIDENARNGSQQILLEQFRQQLSTSQTNLDLIANKKSKRELEKEKKQQKKEAKREEKKREREKRKEKKKNNTLWGSLTVAFGSKEKKDEAVSKTRSAGAVNNSKSVSPIACSPPVNRGGLSSRSPGGSYVSSSSPKNTDATSRPLTQSEILQTIKKLHALNQLGAQKKTEAAQQKKPMKGSSIHPHTQKSIEDQFEIVQRRRSESSIPITKKNPTSPPTSGQKPNPLKISADSTTKREKRPPSITTNAQKDRHSTVDKPKRGSDIKTPPSPCPDDFKETPLSGIATPTSVTSSEDVEAISPLCVSPPSVVQDSDDPLEDNLEIAAEMTITDAKHLLEQLANVPNLAEQLRELTTLGKLPDFDDLRFDIAGLGSFESMDESRDLASLGLNLDICAAEDVLDTLAPTSPSLDDFYVNPDDEELCIKGKQLQVLEQLGKGASATVWKGSIDGKLFALKTMSLVGVRNRRVMRRMLRDEVEMMKCFKHPNVIRYYGLFYSKQTQEINIVLELIEGGSLTKLISDKKRFSDKVAATITYQILNGLSFLHSNKIIHRDLKPDNMLLSNGLVKLIDFGTSTKVLEIKTCRRSTVGTPWYTAPEVINAEEYSFPADIWSLGCLLLELLTGKPPFHDLNPVACLFKMASEDPPIPEGLSPTATAFLQSCWNREWKERPTPEQLLKHPFIIENVNLKQNDLSELLQC